MFEDNSNSANMNIAKKIIRELSQNHDVYGCFCFSENVHDALFEREMYSFITIGNSWKNVKHKSELPLTIRIAIEIFIIKMEQYRKTGN